MRSIGRLFLCTGQAAIYRLGGAARVRPAGDVCRAVLYTGTGFEGVGRTVRFTGPRLYAVNFLFPGGAGVMDAVARWIILVEWVVFTLFVLGFNLLQRFRGKSRLGMFPIHPALFVVGKLSMGATWALLLLQVALGPERGVGIPSGLAYGAAGLILVGTGLVIAAFIDLKSDSRFGLSEEVEVPLRTQGVYALSRNPMYLGFYLVTLAAMLVMPHGATIVLGLVGIYLHHRVVLAEERFLAQMYGDEYVAYTRRVRRYM